MFSHSFVCINFVLFSRMPFVRLCVYVLSSCSLSVSPPVVFPIHKYNLDIKNQHINYILLLNYSSHFICSTGMTMQEKKTEKYEQKIKIEFERNEKIQSRNQRQLIWVHIFWHKNHTNATTKIQRKTERNCCMLIILIAVNS